MLLRNECLLVIIYLMNLISFGLTKSLGGFTGEIQNNKTVERFPRSSIIFPEVDDDYPEESFLEVDGTPPCSRGATFCEHYNNYPQSLVKTILRRHKVNPVFFGTDVVPPLDSRRDEVDKFICQSITRTVFPKVGKNIKNDWRIIINQGHREGFVQGVVIETCLGNNRRCDLFGDMVDNYVTTCKQKFIYRRLLSINKAGSPVQDTFVFPSACCCSYRRTFDFMSRLGT